MSGIRKIVSAHRLWLSTRAAIHGIFTKSDRGMAEIVNLRRARKKAERIDQSQQAALNRAASGRSKSELQLEQARRLKAGRDLELHRIEREDGA